MTETHSKHSPSALPNKEICPGWLSDPTPGPMAIRGTAIHGHLATLVPLLDHAATVAAYAAALARVPVEHTEVVNTGMDMLRGLHQRFPDHQWQAEVRLDTGIPDVYGTGDVIGVSEWSPVGVVVDWKTGRGDRDDAGTSLQTAAYALGLLRRYPHLSEVLVVMGELEQTPTEALWSRAALEAADKRIRQVVIACELGSDEPASYTAHPKACQYCARREGCPALARKVTETAAQMPTNPVEAVRAMTPVELGAALLRYRPGAKLVEQFIEALEDRAKELLAADPKAVPGFMLKDKNGPRGWTAPEDVVRQAITAEFPGLSLDTIASPTVAEERIAERLKKAGTKGFNKKAAEAIKGLCKPQAQKSLVET